ncbi:HPP family protein [Vibrio mangrovi]|uniref:HPP family protein n=1 Tax=Vibrio mangrovi TaxID=474394 RepID=A0A1Y6IMQ9_9VIBR|nr:HPP family protein [Vibrio mangrovi]MDW6004264.1 HPP family protein [Vibrio mangrovi]SMR98937.1 HPP family protein [Vibrio mangrovi]
MNKFYLALLSGTGAAIAIGILAFSETVQTDLVLLMAPFGASAVLVFGLPESPLAQPKNVILGHLLTAFIGVFFAEFIAVTPFTLAIASGLAVTAMLLTHTTHPPAGANPLLIMLTGQSWGFLFTPVLLGAIILVVIGQIIRKAHISLAMT